MNEDRMTVTPGPITAIKLQKKHQGPEKTIADPKSTSTAIGFMSMGEAESNERILPSPGNANGPSQTSFEEEYANFQRMVRDLSDDHERNSNTMLNLNELLATAHAETLQDQGDLAMFLGDMCSFNADLDDQIGEYETFLASFPESDESE